MIGMSRYTQLPILPVRMLAFLLMYSCSGLSPSAVCQMLVNWVEGWGRLNSVTGCSRWQPGQTGKQHAGRVSIPSGPVITLAVSEQKANGTHRLG